VEIGKVRPDLVQASRNGWFDDSDEMFFMGFGSGEGGSMVAKATWVHALENEDSVRPLGIYLGEAPVGYVLFSPDAPRKIMGVTLWIHPDSRGKGVGTTALSEVCGALFSRGVYRVETEVLRHDRRACAFLRRFGMKQEAYRIRSLWIDNKPYDTTMYRVLFPDWEAREEGSHWQEVS
jgi:RimJ/RimL family protein N-acetyltransferase